MSEDASRKSHPQASIIYTATGKTQGGTLTQQSGLQHRITSTKIDLNATFVLVISADMTVLTFSLVDTIDVVHLPPECP